MKQIYNNNITLTSCKHAFNTSVHIQFEIKKEHIKSRAMGKRHIFIAHDYVPVSTISQKHLEAKTTGKHCTAKETHSFTFSSPWGEYMQCIFYSCSHSQSTNSRSTWYPLILAGERRCGFKTCPCKAFTHQTHQCYGNQTSDPLILGPMP